MLKPTNNSPWLCILFKLKQLEHKRQKKNQLEKANRITNKRFFSESLRTPVQISAGLEVLGICGWMAEYIQTIKEKACKTVTPSLYFETWPWLFSEENSKFGAWRALGLMTLHFSSSKVYTDPQMCVHTSICCFQLLLGIQLLKCATSMTFDIQSFSWDLYFIVHHFLPGANEISGIQFFLKLFPF